MCTSTDHPPASLTSRGRSSKEDGETTSHTSYACGCSVSRFFRTLGINRTRALNGSTRNIVARASARPVPVSVRFALEQQLMLDMRVDKARTKLKPTNRVMAMWSCLQKQPSWKIKRCWWQSWKHSLFHVLHLPHFASFNLGLHLKVLGNVFRRIAVCTSPSGPKWDWHQSPLRVCTHWSQCDGNPQCPNIVAKLEDPWESWFLEVHQKEADTVHKQTGLFLFDWI